MPELKAVKYFELYCLWLYIRSTQSINDATWYGTTRCKFIRDGNKTVSFYESLNSNSGWWSSFQTEITPGADTWTVGYLNRGDGTGGGHTIEYNPDTSTLTLLVTGRVGTSQETRTPNIQDFMILGR